MGFGVRKEPCNLLVSLMSRIQQLILGLCGDFHFNYHCPSFFIKRSCKTCFSWRKHSHVIPGRSLQTSTQALNSNPQTSDYLPLYVHPLLLEFLSLLVLFLSFNFMAAITVIVLSLILLFALLRVGREYWNTGIIFPHSLLTLNPKPQTLNPKPYIRLSIHPSSLVPINPKPQTLNLTLCYIILYFIIYTPLFPSPHKP